MCRTYPSRDVHSAKTPNGNLNIYGTETQAGSREHMTSHTSHARYLFTVFSIVQGMEQRESPPPSSYRLNHPLHN